MNPDCLQSFKQIVERTCVNGNLSLFYMTSVLPLSFFKPLNQYTFSILSKERQTNIAVLLEGGTSNRGSVPAWPPLLIAITLFLSKEVIYIPEQLP
jgi:hypothetical protein